MASAGPAALPWHPPTAITARLAPIVSTCNSPSSVHVVTHGLEMSDRKFVRA